MTMVESDHIVKSFSGKTAVNDLSFTIAEGEIFGLIGPNGAGKSTTIKLILDFIKPDSGSIKMLGGNTFNENMKNQIGYLPEERGLYKKLPAIDLIIYLASLKGMDRRKAEKKADELLRQTGMLSNKKMKIGEMSKGMGQIIQLIVTIIHDPNLIILDEPFSGLDPVNTDLLKRLLIGLRDRGKAIILSTHRMNDVEELCDRVLMINNGCAVLYGDLKEIKSGYGNHSVLVDIEGETGELPGVIEKRQHKGFVELVLDKDTTPRHILEKLFKSGITVNRFESAALSLNDIFLKKVGKYDQ